MTRDEFAIRSFAYPTLPMTQGKRRVLRSVNDFEDARRDLSKRAIFEKQLLDSFEAYRQTDADRELLPNGGKDWKWHLLTMEAMVEGTLGHFNTAAELNRESLLVEGITGEQKAIAYNNLSDHLRRGGQFIEAEHAARQAFALWPGHGGVVCNLVLALERNGKSAEVDKMVEAIAAFVDFSDSKNVVGANAQFDEELRHVIQKSIARRKHLA